MTLSQTMVLVVWQRSPKSSKWTPLVNYDTPMSTLGTPAVSTPTSVSTSVINSTPWRDEGDGFVAFEAGNENIRAQATSSSHAEKGHATDTESEDEDGDEEGNFVDIDLDEADGDVQTHTAEVVESTIVLGNFQPVPPVDLGTVEKEGTTQVRAPPLLCKPFIIHV